MSALNPTLAQVTERIRERSRATRRAYLDKVQRAAAAGPHRDALGCSNLAHGFAGCPAEDKETLASSNTPNVAIVSAYNDMLSAHQPLESYPAIVKAAVREVGAVAQFAGGVPAMCDGITQGYGGMELSLWSRDAIAQSTAVALTHDMFDAVVCMGVCDKIVPGLMIGALSFGHLPVIFMPAGPMPSGLSNDDKRKVRQRYATGDATREELLKSEMAAYHSPGTCTFFGTANSNQMFMEIMGLQLPGASFVNPGTPLRDAMTRAAAQRVVALAANGSEPTPMAEIVDERAIVNAIVGLMATGGSTNHTIHLVAIARAAGILIDWQDFDDISDIVPLLARVYPNGSADVNQMHDSGGLAFIIGELLDAGLLHGDVRTVAGDGLAHYRRHASLQDDQIAWQNTNGNGERDTTILRGVAEPFQANGGMRLLQGNLGRAVVKISAVKEKYRKISAPARVFDRQEDLQAAFKAGELERDFVAVVRFQGPRANGMPELHKLVPPLSVLQDKGFRVALVTDGRMSGASGKVLAAIHVTPEATADGPLARLRDGDPVTVDSEAGILRTDVPEAEWEARTPAPAPDEADGLGRELFMSFRRMATGAEQGALTFGW